MRDHDLHLIPRRRCGTLDSAAKESSQARIADREAMRRPSTQLAAPSQAVVRKWETYQWEVLRTLPWPSCEDCML